MTNFHEHTPRGDVFCCPSRYQPPSQSRPSYSHLAADALGNCKDPMEDSKKASKPEFRGSVVVYNGRTITYHDDHVTLATVDDSVTAEFVIPEDETGTPFAEYCTNEWERKEATLHKRNGTYYLHVEGDWIAIRVNGCRSCMYFAILYA